MRHAYLIAAALAVVLSACSDGPIDKACKVNVRTVTNLDGLEKKPVVEEKTMVIMIDKAKGTASFNNFSYPTSNLKFEDGTVAGLVVDMNRNDSGGGSNFHRFNYNIKNGVVDALESEILYVTGRGGFTNETVSTINGTCK